MLVTYGNRQFLCTAAHALRGDQHSLFVGGKEPFGLGVFRRNTPKKGYTYDDDPLDIAIVELDRGQCSKALSGARFINLDRDTPWQPFGKRIFMEAYGFLNHDNGLESDRTLTANGIKIPMVVDENHLNHDKRLRPYKNGYVSAFFDPAKLGGVKEDFRGNRVFTGMSGGALYYGDWSCTGLYLELAGMLVEARPAKRGCVRFLALRTRTLIRVLTQFYPDLSPILPPYKGMERRSTLR